MLVALDFDCPASLDVCGSETEAKKKVDEKKMQFLYDFGLEGNNVTQL